VANGGKLIDGDGVKLAVGQLQKDFVAEDFVVGVAPEVHPMPTAFDADDDAARFGGPTFLPHGDEALDLDAVANLQFVELGANVVVTGSHGTIPAGPFGWICHPTKYHYCAKRFISGKRSLGGKIDGHE
jgi:hypothetical protein